MIDRLAGTWRVTHSTFPMWLSGRKTRPTFTYTPATRGGVAVLLDDVSYVQGGRARHIRGVDVPVPGDAGAFVWRGSGLLWPLTSRWRVERFCETWAIISFAPTAFTPAGLDVIARAPLDEATASRARAEIAAVPELRRWLPALQPTSQ